MSRDELRRVEVEWLDSVSLSGWRDPDVVRSELMQPGSLHHVSVGFLLDEADDRLLLALSVGVDPDGSQIDSAMAIPRVAVLEMRDLVKRAARKRRPRK